jgi:hypothetical protein
MDPRVKEAMRQHLHNSNEDEEFKLGKAWNATTRLLRPSDTVKLDKTMDTSAGRST